MATLNNLQRNYLPDIAPEDFFLLLAHATSKEKVSLLAHPEYELSVAEEEKAREYLERRLGHEPVAYIIGHKEFYGRDFLVTKNTLIPRPETELLVEKALEYLEAGSAHDIIDVGTGSGNIIITLAKERATGKRGESDHYYALDISSQALKTAKENAKHHDVSERIVFLESDLLKNFPLPQERNRHAVIVANLPYLSRDIYSKSNPDVRDYEPQSALESGIDGLDHYRALFQILPVFSKHYLSTTFFLEISPEQSESIQAIITQIFPKATHLLFQDLAGKDRLIQATL